MSYALADVARPRARAQELAPTREFIRSVYQAEHEKLREYVSESNSWDSFFQELRSTYTPGVCTLAQDSPDVHLDQPDQLYAPMLEMLARAEHRVLLSTAYLIPDQDMFDLLEELVERGVEVTLLTNSLASNNHLVAHMAYKRSRRTLLRTGVRLFEARDDSAFITEYSTPPVEPGFLGLHSKSIVVDDRYSFVGSPNIDPRSLIINTELGYFCESPELAADLAALIERDISPDAAWRVYFDERGRLRWASSAGIEKNQPALGIMQRVTAFFVNLLPLKSQA
jgi:putative cardiolipin synthase